MKRTWFTSDTHFGHAAVLQHDGRPFASIDEHDESLLMWHNELVQEGDDVYHLGDVSFSKARLRWWLDNAKGHKHLIRGNHDDKLAWKAAGWATRNEALYLRVDGHRIYLSHYAHRVWRNSIHGSFHLYGHSHGCLEAVQWGRSMDVGVSCNNYRPVSLEEVVAKLSVREEKINHHELR
jgi:calcineurin-like phosphoesterase family protein